MVPTKRGIWVCFTAAACTSEANASASLTVPSGATRPTGGIPPKKSIQGRCFLNHCSTSGRTSLTAWRSVSSSRLTIAPATRAPFALKYVSMRSKVSMQSPNPGGPTSRMGAPSAAATVALPNPQHDPTEGYPTPSMTTKRRPSLTDFTAVLMLVISSALFSSCCSSRKIELVNPFRNTTGPTGTASILRAAQNAATSVTLSHCVAGLIYANSSAGTPCSRRW
mmetsp:Transcript_680/g.2384  ORF Transcript_680/g.2384 Transcript_680/m.2384 type:complete len:223 (-) Transcript_680:102-770(-)